MKILKPDKVAQRKFVCPNCKCEFVADDGDVITLQHVQTVFVCCPTCTFTQQWDNGEPYGEPKPTQTDRERLAQLIGETPDVMVWPDARRKITDYLIANGVTFREG